MKIVITDGFPLNSNDLDWGGISSLGELVVHERTSSELIIERSKEAEIILTNKVPFNKQAIESSPKLKLINVLATGYDIIDIDAAKQKGVIVCNVPGYGTASVAQHTFALLLELSNHVGLHAASTASGKWQQSKDWCYLETSIMELSGKTFGIVGFGNIGQKVADIAASFGMEILYYSLHRKDSLKAKYVDLSTLFSESDVVSLHCPLRNDNFQFVNMQLLQLMKKTAFLINTSRGLLIQEHDLAAALNKGLIAGAALDVLSTEPPGPDNPLLSASNCLITPHNAWMSKEARQRIVDMTAKNIQAFLNGAPLNWVNK